MSSEERDRQLYKYPGSHVLRNRLDIRDAAELHRAERLLVRQRLEEGSPDGDFDLSHLKAIHKHLFQDVYEWAGEIREVPLQKGESTFFPPNRIGLAMQDIHNRILKQNYLQGFDRISFAHEAGAIIGDVNLVHPFREGNGRVQFQYLQKLGEKVGYIIDLTRFNRDEWMKASVEANHANPQYNLMRVCIQKAIVPV